MQDSHYEDALARQLAMNRKTWLALKEHGIAEGAKLRLDFSYNAPNREAAEKLVSLFRGKKDYEVAARSSGSFIRRKWYVEGRTHEIALSPEILDQWVTWMVTAGKGQRCEFDGWGTSL